MQSLFKNISRVSEEINVPQHTLRYWENYFNLPKIIRIRKRRYYRKKDIDRLKQIKYLIQNEYRTYKGVKKFLQRQQAILQNVPQESKDEPNRSFKVDL